MLLDLVFSHGGLEYQCRILQKQLFKVVSDRAIDRTVFRSECPSRRGRLMKTHKYHAKLFSGLRYVDSEYFAIHIISMHIKIIQ